MLTVIVAAVSLYYALAGEINANKLALDVLKEDVAEIKADLKQAQFNTRVTRLEERVVSASEDLQRLETKTDALDDRMRTLERSRRRR